MRLGEHYFRSVRTADFSYHQLSSLELDVVELDHTDRASVVVADILIIIARAERRRSNHHTERKQ